MEVEVLPYNDEVIMSEDVVVTSAARRDRSSMKFPAARLFGVRGR